jgi:hypothetical protein
MQLMSATCISHPDAAYCSAATALPTTVSCPTRELSAELRLRCTAAAHVPHNLLALIIIIIITTHLLPSGNTAHHARGQGTIICMQDAQDCPAPSMGTGFLSHLSCKRGTSTGGQHGQPLRDVCQLVAASAHRPYLRDIG